MSDVASSFLVAVRRLDRILTAADSATLAGFGLTITQYIAMMGLAKSLGETSAHMARCMGVSPQAAHSLVMRLASQGYLHRFDDEHSDVVILNRLTDRGDAVASVANGSMEQIEDARRDQLGATEYASLLESLVPHLPVSRITGSPAQVAAQEKIDRMVRTRLGASARHVTLVYSSELGSALRQSGLTATQYFVLEQLPIDRPKTTSQLALDAAVPQQTGSSAVLGLERIGALQSAPAPHHVGLALRSLTPAGAELFELARQLATPTLQRMTRVAGHEALARATVLLGHASSAFARTEPVAKRDER